VTEVGPTPGSSALKARLAFLDEGADVVLSLLDRDHAAQLDGQGIGTTPDLALRSDQSSEATQSRPPPVDRRGTWPAAPRPPPGRPGARWLASAAGGTR